MNSDHHDSGLTENPAAIGIDDICFTLFRHKWLILGFICLGLVAAAGMRITHPPKYASRAELMVKFVVDRQATTPMTQEGHVLSAESGQNIMSTEIEMIKSLDVAKGAAMLLDPEIMSRMGVGTNRMWAAGVIETGIEVENPRSTSILAVMYKHRDQTIVQPALEAIITAYQMKHNAVYGYGSRVDSLAVQKRDEYRAQLAATDQAIKSLTATNHLVSLDEAKHTYQKQIDDWQERLHTLEADLVGRTAILGSVAAGSETNASEAAVPNETIIEYTELVSQIENLRRNKQELRLHYTEAWPTVINVQNRIDQASKDKAELEKQFPALARMSLTTNRGGTNSAEADLSTLRGIQARVNWTRTFVSNLQWQAQAVMELEPQLNDLQRQRSLLETNYNSWNRIINDSLNAAGLGPGNMINMSVIQDPTPPWRDMKKLMKLLGGAFGGCAAAGIGLAFLLDYVINRTINRGADVERRLKLPVLLSIPDFNWNRNGKKPTVGIAAEGSHRNGENGGAITIWDPRSSHIEMYADGLRERLMTHFESRNLNLKKPKLVAVTECGEGAGVTVIANNLAASLSRTSGNVLLVDMKGETGAARAFYGGRPGRTVSNLLDPESVSGTNTQPNESGEENGEENNNKLACALPSKFTHIVPKLRASDYDYIVFDMPAISPMSATPRLGGYMDIVLLVLEAEKTGQELAARATTLMRESRANVAAVVNKYRPHVPARLSQEL
jgi:uncharacterized protein involved in exopolysaccharide biosynthesis/Mrp family chromosome partitioning ATPase